MNTNMASQLPYMSTVHIFLPVQIQFHLSTQCVIVPSLPVAIVTVVLLYLHVHVLTHSINLPNGLIFSAEQSAHWTSCCQIMVLLWFYVQEHIQYTVYVYARVYTVHACLDIHVLFQLLQILHVDLLLSCASTADGRCASSCARSAALLELT